MGLFENQDKRISECKEFLKKLLDFCEKEGFPVKEINSFDTNYYDHDVRIDLRMVKK